jgi:hypothetical protein
MYENTVRVHTQGKTEKYVFLINAKIEALRISTANTFFYIINNILNFVQMAIISTSICNVVFSNPHRTHHSFHFPSSAEKNYKENLSLIFFKCFYRFYRCILLHSVGTFFCNLIFGNLPFL